MYVSTARAYGLGDAASAAQYGLDVQQAEAANNAQQCLDNANNATPGPQRDAALAACSGQYAIQGGTPAAAPGIFSSAGPSYSPSFSFSTSRGGTAMQVGDTWTVRITGAQPSASVWVNGSMPGGAIVNSVQGQTDGSGSFSKSGVADATTVGNWSERWNVGNSSVGQVQFTVTPASSAPAGAPAASPGISLPASPPAATSSGFDFSSIPWWGWAAGAGVAVLAFSGGGGRR